MKDRDVQKQHGFEASRGTEAGQCGDNGMNGGEEARLADGL